jgi:hypothetical protein
MPVQKGYDRGREVAEGDTLFSSCFVTVITFRNAS